MAKYESKQLRNLAVIGHGGTGKPLFVNRSCMFPAKMNVWAR